MKKLYVITSVIVFTVIVVCCSFLLFTSSFKNSPHHFISQSTTITTTTPTTTTPTTTPTTTNPKPITPPPKKNRIAILLSGAIRSFPKIYPFIRNTFFAQNDFPDLFISLVWTSIQERDDYLRIRPFLRNVKYERVEQANMTALKSKVQHLYPGFPFPPEKCREFLTPQGCNNWISSLYLINETFGAMKEYNDRMVLNTETTVSSQTTSNVKDHIQNYYDVVFRLRTDILFEQNVKLLNFKVSPNTFYTSNLYNWLGGFNDQIGFGSIDVMQTYANFIHDVDRIQMETGKPYHPETYLKNCIVKKHNFQLLPISYRVIRSIEYAAHTLESRDAYDDYQ